MGGWAEGRRAKGLGLAGGGGLRRGEDAAAADGEIATVSLLVTEGEGEGALAGCLHMRTNTSSHALGGIMPPRAAAHSMTL